MFSCRPNHIGNDLALDLRRARRPLDALSSQSSSSDEGGLMNSTKLRTFCTVAAVTACGMAFVGCTTTRPDDRASTASSRASIDAQVDASLSKLYDSVPD